VDEERSVENEAIVLAWFDDEPFWGKVKVGEKSGYPKWKG